MTSWKLDSAILQHRVLHVSILYTWLELKVDRRCKHALLIPAYSAARGCLFHRWDSAIATKPAAAGPHHSASVVARYIPPPSGPEAEAYARNTQACARR